MTITSFFETAFSFLQAIFGSLWGLTVSFILSINYKALLIYFFTAWQTYAALVLAFILFFIINRIFFVRRKQLRQAESNIEELSKISEQNRAVASLEKNTAETIINVFTDGLLIFDQERKIVSINPEADRILGLGQRNFIGKSLQSLEEFEKAKPILDVLNQGEQIIYRKEVELRKDFIVELSTTPLGAIGNNVGYLVTLHDISQAKANEKMKTEFITLAAHQLRTPLSTVKWSMGMLKNGDYGKLTKQQKDLVEGIFQNTERLVSMVNNLVFTTYIEVGSFSYKMDPSDIVKAVKSAIDSYEGQTKEKGLQVNFHAPENLPKIMFDNEKIKIVIQNFLDNAIKFSKQGGKLEVAIQKTDKDVEVKVQDFGSGIPEKLQDKIFTKYFRGDDATKQNMNGSGLGLYLSKNIIDSHGGTIWFNSKEDQGSSFFFTLPLPPEK